MEERAPVTSSSSVASTATSSSQREGRNLWVLTAYGISGLALLGVLAYYVSDYIAH